GLKLTVLTGPVWPRSAVTTLPVVVDSIVTVPVEEPIAIRRPSGRNASELICPLIDGSTIRRPEARFHTYLSVPQLLAASSDSSLRLNADTNPAAQVVRAIRRSRPVRASTRAKSNSCFEWVTKIVSAIWLPLGLSEPKKPWGAGVGG